MAVQQFTKCIEPENFEERSRIAMAAAAAAFASPFIALAILMHHPWCLVFVAELGWCMFWVLYCENWLYERLICLGEFRDAVGMVVQIDEPKFNLKFWDYDNDYCFNLLLQCTEFGVQEGDAALQDSPFGELIKNQDVITALGSKVHGDDGYETDGYMVPLKTPGVQNPIKSATLHCELEGSVVHDLNLIMKIMLGISVGAFALCMFVPLWVSVIIMIIIFILIFAGMYGSKEFHPGSPSDVNSDLPTIHHGNAEGLGADILYVQGRWIYDPLHEGWNEIHPVTYCSKVGTWDGDWDDYDCDSVPPDIILRLRNGVQEARADQTIAIQ
jgi:hypothetical protein